MIRLPDDDDPAVSLIVVLDGGAEMAERCLRAVEAGAGMPCETVLLLNDPDQPLERLVRRSTTGARVILSRVNAGLGVAWNLGAAVAKAPLLATMHEDSEPEAGWLQPLCEAMNETGAGAVGSRLYNGDGSIQNCGWVLFSDASPQPLNAKTAPEVAAAIEPTPADTVSGASMLVDREALRQAGGWDERFHPAVFTDIDMSTTVWSQGRPVLSVPASRVRHTGSTFDSRPNSVLSGPRLRLFLLERNRARFTDKWTSAVAGLAPPPADLEPDTIKAAVQAALPHTRARAERVRKGELPSRAPGRAKLRFTGLDAPVLQEAQSAYAVAPPVEAALRDAERELVDDYCRWLVERDSEVSGQLATAHEMLGRQRQDIDTLNATIAVLRQQTEDLSNELVSIVNSRAWRLRALLARLLRGGGRVVSRRKQ